MILPVCQKLMDKCIEHGCEAPAWGEKNEQAMEKILVLIEKLESQIKGETHDSRSGNSDSSSDAATSSDTDRSFASDRCIF